MALGFTTSERPEWTVYHCGHLVSRDETLHCNKDGAWHGMVISGSKVAAMMVSCDDHEADMRLSADYAHRLEHPCCVPGSVVHLAGERVRDRVGRVGRVRQMVSSAAGRCPPMMTS